MSKHHFSYLALGDSYTIGEGVPLHHCFPYQAVQLLRAHGQYFNAPEIVAKTGWTTAELAEHILHTKLNEQYDFVSLLVGVNNQYRGLNTIDYKNDFEFLLRKALHFAADKPQHVIVLSIPDWSVTPFAKDRKQKKIADEIDAFNVINQNIAAQYKVQYVNITESTRDAADDESLIAFDKLHYSSKEYAKWARLVSYVIEKAIQVKQ